jgi:hypothetical protein
MKKIIEIPTNKVFQKEKETYKFLKDYVFDEAVKLYTPIIRGFPDFIAVSYKKPYDDILKPAFVEVKLNNGKLSLHQAKFLGWLSRGFTVYVFHVKTIADGSIIQVREWD